MPAPDVTKVLVGVATAYTAPAFTDPPEDDLAIGAAWESPWAYIGGTEEGVTLGVGSETGEIRIEENSIPAFIVTTSKTVTVSFALSEDTLDSMKLAYGGGTISTTAAGAGQVGKKTLQFSDTLEELAVGFEAKNAAGFWRRVYIPRVLSAGSVETVYRRAANNRSYAVSLRAICAPSDIVIDDMAAVATS